MIGGSTVRSRNGLLSRTRSSGCPDTRLQAIEIDDDIRKFWHGSRAHSPIGWWDLANVHSLAASFLPSCVDVVVRLGLAIEPVPCFFGPDYTIW